MNRFTHIVWILIVSFMLTDFSLACAQKPDDSQLIATAEKVSGDQFPYKTKTPKGARVYAVKKQTKQMLKAIDKGLVDLFAAAKKNNYKSKTKYSDYIVFVAKPDITNDKAGNYIPALAVPTGQYKDTKYDAGGFMYVAGMVLSNDPCAMIIGEHEKSFNLASDFVRYEGEHLILYHNDRKRYTETMDHSKGGAHPILN